MADEMLRRNLDRTFDPGPDFPHHLLLSRTMAMLDAEAPAGGRDQGRGRNGSWFSATFPTTGLRLIASALAVMLAVAAIAVFFATRYPLSPTPVPASPPSTRGVLAMPTGSVTAAQPVLLNAPSSNVLWALVANAYLYRSTDRGLIWEQRPRPRSLDSVSEISFINDREGWLVNGVLPPVVECFPGEFLLRTTVWHTADAGATWQALGANGVPAGQCVSGLSFLDSAHGFLGAHELRCCYGDNGSYPLVIYRTSDGGLTWSPAHVGPGPDTPVLPIELGLVRAFGSELLVPAYQYGKALSQSVYRSPDGGATWSFVADGQYLPLYGQAWAGSLVPVTGSRWLQLNAFGPSTETTDAGATWHAYPSDFSQAQRTFMEVLFADSQIGYANVAGARAAPSQTLQITVDGGLHWSPLRTPWK